MPGLGFAKGKSKQGAARVLSDEREVKLCIRAAKTLEIKELVFVGVNAE